MVLQIFYVHLYEVYLAVVAAKGWNLYNLRLFLVYQIYVAFFSVTSHPEKRVFTRHVYLAGILTFSVLRYENMMHSGLRVREVTGFLAVQIDIVSECPVAFLKKRLFFKWFLHCDR